MKNRTKELFKIAGAAALTLMLASGAFIGINSVAFALATQPEEMPVTGDVKSAYQVVQIEPEDYTEPALTVIMRENLDENGKPYPHNIPGPSAMPYEEAAQIGARYIYEMFGESIDGKVVEMGYAAWPYSSRAYWHGTVADSLEDLKLPGSGELKFEAEEGFTLAAAEGHIHETLYSFYIDAVTGEWVSIYPTLNIAEPTELGEGKSYTLSPEELEAMQYKAPEDADVYAQVAREFAQRHFRHSTVVSVEFVMISLNQGSRSETIEQAKAYREAYQEDKDKPFTFTLYEKGRSIAFSVTDDTGRTAYVDIYMDTKQVTSLDTTGSDFIPGYTYESIDGVG